MKKTLILRALSLAAMMSPCGGEDIGADHVGTYGTNVYQTYGASGQFTFEFDGNELFYVDLRKKETVWRLPKFNNITMFEIQSALRNIVMSKRNLDILMKNSNFTPATNDIPEVAMFPKSSVVLGIPNTLICQVDNVFPPVINITWFYNGRFVAEGIAETTFYPKSDHSFLKFSYLTFLPASEDFYDCRVEHWGLEEPLVKHWEPKIPAPTSELTETVVCALGLPMGLMGIVVGTVLLLRVRCSGAASRRRRAMSHGLKDGKVISLYKKRKAWFRLQFPILTLTETCSLVHFITELLPRPPALPAGADFMEEFFLRRSLTLTNSPNLVFDSLPTCHRDLDCSTQPPSSWSL